MSDITLQVEGVSKRYGAHQALKSATLTARRGEVIALLGRNGAGKSTLMNIITGYLAMTAGTVSICGHDVQSAPLEARKHVGYLPEQPPLYLDMTVREYLRYCAQLKGISRPRDEIDRVIEATSLGEYASRLTRKLSKGYRQRLGVAQALLGSPALLILDEPGNGLDPVQMMHMRELVRQSGQESTVLLSSHLLSEVTAVCERAIVIEKGVIHYDGPMSRLTEDADTLHVRWRGGDNIHEALAALPGALEVTARASRESGCMDAELSCEQGQDLRADVFRLFAASDAELLELTPMHQGLEEAFLRLVEEEKEA